MERRTKQRFGLVVVMAGLLLAAAIAFASEESPSEAAERGEASPNEGAVDAEDGGGEAAPRMDVAFVLDATGSMHDEIEVIKEEIRQVAEAIESGEPTPEVRFALVAYRDKTDEVVVESIGLTRDVGAIYRKLEALEAAGGGDRRVHGGAGLDAAHDQDWEMGSEVARSIYLVGDAPAHTDYPRGPDVRSIVAESRARQIPIETVGCSGIEGAGGEAQFASFSSATGGRYRSLTYHTVVESEAGNKRSVIYRDGRFYVADEVIDGERWRRRAGALVESEEMRPATGRTVQKARAAAETDNNLDEMLRQEIQARMHSRGVDYR